MPIIDEPRGKASAYGDLAVHLSCDRQGVTGEVLMRGGIKVIRIG
jgi:hypothetical protein